VKSGRCTYGHYDSTAPSDQSHPANIQAEAYSHILHRTPHRKGTTMAKNAKTSVTTKKQLVALLNEDLQREFQAVIAYVNYSQVLKGAAYMNIAGELEVHAGEELKHALKLSYWIDLLGGMPAVTAKSVKTSEKATDMLRFDLENEKETIRNYRRRVKQADALDEFALSEDLRDILRDEQDHLNALATALGEDTPDPGIAAA